MLEKIKFAIKYLENGLSVIPTDKNKIPTIRSWKPYQQNRPTIDDVVKWWKTDENSLAIICGKVSKNLEIIDFDEKYNFSSVKLIDQWKELVEARSPGLNAKLVLQSTINKGYHAIYRCDSIQGNQKLAQRVATSEEIAKDNNIKSFTLIETRGESGYFLSYPSQGYLLVQGNLLAIPNITPEEREVLLSSARSLNTLIDQKSIYGDENKRNTKENRPGDEFNKNGNHTVLLQSHGWKFVNEKNGNEYWRRPGKEKGISASYNKQIGLFYVFSSNASPFHNEKSYNKFALYTHLEANGDFRLAAQKLTASGFEGSSNDENTLTLIQLVENYLNSKYLFRRNVVTTKIEMRKHTDNTFSEIDDIKLNSLHRELQKKKLKFGIDSLHRLLNSNYTKEYDPFFDYFESLKVWDGNTDYIDILAKTVNIVDTVDADDFKKFLQKWLIGMVACAIHDKSVNQAAIIFVGPQGVGKSRWLNKLVPTALSKYLFVGSIDPLNKDAVVYISECILVNLDELETLRQADIGALKSLMTQQVIKVRRPYDRLPQDMVRRASFVGSINKTEFLDDPTGSRRFLTFEVKSCDVNNMPNMDDVFAQAYILLKKGERWWFDDNEINMINDKNKKYSKSSYEEELLLEICPPNFIEENKQQWRTATQIAEKIKYYKPDFRIDNASVSKIGKALVKNKYVSKKIKGIKLYGL